MKDKMANNRNVLPRRLAGFVTLSLFLLVSLWSVFPLKGKTLPMALAERCRIHFKPAAAMVSVFVGVLGTAGAVLMVYRDK